MSILVMMIGIIKTTKDILLKKIQGQWRKIAIQKSIHVL